MILWGMYPIFTHHFVESVDPFFLVAITTLFSSIPFMVKIAFQKKLRTIFSQKTLLQLIPVALFAGVGHLFLFVGTSITTGINTGILLQIEPAYALLIGIILFHEKFKKQRFFATLIMVIGAMFIVYKGTAMPNTGDVLVLLTTLMYQLSHSFAKKLLNKKIDSAIILCGRQLIAGIILISIFGTTNSSFIKFIQTPSYIWIGFYLGFYLAAVTFIWYAALRKMPLSVASSFLPLTAVVAFLGSVFFLKENINSNQIIGFVFIISGMIWLGKINRSKVTKS